jgi:hypothetical protein
MYGRMQYCTAGSCEASPADYASALTNWAKVEILREKVKERMEKKYGEQLDKAADLIVEVATRSVKETEALEQSQEDLQEVMDGMYDSEEEG